MPYGSRAMADDDRQQGLRGRLTGGRSAGKRPVGAPNVLSGASVPNQLSNQAKQPAPVAIGTRPASEAMPAPARPGPAGPASAPSTAPGRTMPQSDAPAGGRRLPALPTLIFLGFVGLTAFRLVGEFLEGAAADPTAAPAATTLAPGLVRFGTSLDDDCNPIGEASTFAEFTEVWWVADMATRQKASVTVIVIVRLDGEELEREVVPPDGSTTSWEVLCGQPVGDGNPGVYRVEVWNEDESVLQSVGEFTVAPGSS